jgi:hypothetical protein
VTGALLAGACGTTSKSDAQGETPSHPGAAPTTPTTRRVMTTTVPTTVPAYSFDDSVPPPKLINTGTDYVAILKSLSAYGNWLAAHRPDPALVSDIVAPGTRQHELFTRDLMRLRDSNKRAVELLGAPTTYSILSARRDAVSARVVEDIKFQRSIDASGRVTSEVKFAHPTTYRSLLVLSRGRWYYAADEIESSQP